MKLIVIGLGNPGSEYANTYHNVGLLFVDFLSDPDKPFKKDRFFLYQDREKYALVKTAVYMNESGSAVSAALKRFAHTVSTKTMLILVHDDSDITIGNYKLGEGSGAAGHKGVESVMRAIGNSDFKRLRIGIRSEQKNIAAEKKPRLKAGDFVLRNISKSDKETLHSVFVELKRSVIEKVD